MASPRPRRPAALSAFYLAFPLGVLGTAGYAVLVRGDNLLDRLTLRQDLTVVGVVFLLWLTVWALIAAFRRWYG
ncbi:MAG TPA: hypothetical protein VGJ53_14440 [Micromonosporaceae bacterium]|jgi:hypothetical protein